MKKLALFLIFFSFINSFSNAQIVLQRSDYGAIGSIIRYGIDTPSNPALLNSRALLFGDNRLWNFSTVVLPNKFDSISFSYPGLGAPANANLLVQSATNSHFEQVDSAFARYIVDRPNNKITGLIIKYLPFPFTYGNTLIDSMIYKKVGTPDDFNAVVLNTLGYDSVQADIRIYDTTICTGWGYLMLPDTGCNTLQVKVISTTYMSLMGRRPATGWSSINAIAGILPYQKSFEYLWFAKNGQNFVARAGMDANGQNVQSFRYKVKKVLIPELVNSNIQSVERGNFAEYTVYGKYTRFTRGLTVVQFQRGLQTLVKTKVLVVNDTLCKVGILVKQSDSIGMYDLVLVDPVYGSLMLKNALEVKPSAILPEITAFIPNNIERGRTTNIVIKGSASHFLADSGVFKIDFLNNGVSKSGFTILTQKVVNDSLIEMSLSVDSLVDIGDYTLEATNYIDGVLKPFAFKVILPVSLPEEVAFSQLFDISPNPSNGSFLVQAKKWDGNCAFELFDSHSRKVFSVELDRPETHLELNYLPNGLYVCLIQTSNGIYLKRLVVSNP